jgi:hypothetical protein
MAYEFDGTTDELEFSTGYPGTVVTAVPLTLAAWFKTDTTSAGNYMIVSLGGDSASNEQMFSLYQGGTPSDTLVAHATNGSWAAAQTSAGLVSTGTWYHGCGVFATTTSRSVYLDGGNKVTNTTFKVPNAATGMDGTFIGQSATVKYDQNFNGRIAEVAIWNVVLSDDEVAMAAAGMPHWNIRPANLVGYYPLVNSALDLSKNTLNLSATGTPAAVADHPPISIVRPWVVTPAGAGASVPTAPSGLSVAVI